MKSYRLSFLLAFALSLDLQTSAAQKLLTGRVFDKETGKHIGSATVLNPGTDFKTITNALGFFQVEVTDSTRLQIISDGYVPLMITIPAATNFKVELTKQKINSGLETRNGPSFPGGIEAFLNYITKNISIPPAASKGTIKIQLYVAADGTVLKDSVKIIQSLCVECDRQALKVVKKSPKWNPNDSPEIPIIIPIVIR